MGIIFNQLSDLISYITLLIWIVSFIFIFEKGIKVVFKHNLFVFFASITNFGFAYMCKDMFNYSYRLSSLKINSICFCLSTIALLIFSPFILIQRYKGHLERKNN